MSWVVAPDNINPEFNSALIESMDWLELDGYQVDYNVIRFDDYNDMEVEVYINEILAGVAYHYDDLPKVVDRFWTEGGDN